ncbi:hypothetical protein PRUPE_6G327900 [Prunus persica]|uniref:Uncharacterized protein n=1 Tax=Prunus persica TaxID=3760 RepID=A0A251P2G6_PRUPE|nr:hypothetical protein PRUPE_6G327900 [Prunus persica]
MSEANRKLLEDWKPVYISVCDVTDAADTCQTYSMKLEKKESYCRPLLTLIDLTKAREHFFYTIGPFGRIVDKRKLLVLSDREIGPRWSDNNKDTLEFTVFPVPRLDLRTLF